MECLKHNFVCILTVQGKLTGTQDVHEREKRSLSTGWEGYSILGQRVFTVHVVIRHLLCIMRSRPVRTHGPSLWLWSWVKGIKNNSRRCAIRVPSARPRIVLAQNTEYKRLRVVRYRECTYAIPCPLASGCPRVLLRKWWN